MEKGQFEGVNDPELEAILAAQKEQNEDGFTLIASENHPHPSDIAAVRAAYRATFAGKYAEGYPPAEGKAPGSGRYYQGCGPADMLESLAKRRVVEAIAHGDPYAVANVQVPSGAIANVTA